MPTNTELVQQVFDAINAHDVEALRELWADDVEERFPDKTCRGKEELSAYFAGLFGYAKIGEQWVTSATILTTGANEVCAPVHDRMPVVLAGPDEEAAWLAGADDPVLMVPLAAARTTARPANPAVNRAGVEGPELLDPPPPEPAAQQTLL